MLENFLGVASRVDEDWLVHAESAKHLRDEIARITLAVRQEAGDAMQIDSGVTHRN